MGETKLNRAGFLGQWVLDRQINDRLSEKSGVLTGIAHFTPQGADSAMYEEVGTLRIGAGPAFQAVRSYHWQFTPDAVVVRFSDGRDFLTFSPEGDGGAVHHCDPDIYRVAHDFSAWPQRWEAVWTVTGPRKDYTLQSCYTRG